MLVPLSWLKEYVDITLTPKELGEKLTEIGLGCEKITKTPDDVIFELEITPNRPDCLSIIGIAREVAAIEGKRIKYPGVNGKHPEGVNVSPESKKNFPLVIKTDPEINPRFTGIILAGIKVGESPKWLKDRLEKMNQKPISNIVDITNYVMLELGNPIHAFDYDKITGHTMIVSKSKGGEKFETVDGIIYHLPKDAVVISDKEKTIDLCGIKGGKNSGTYEGTKNIFIRVPVELPNLIRRTSQALGLRSEASSIFERGVNTGGTIDALKRCVDLVLEIAGGKIASNLYDIKTQDFKPWKLRLRLERLSKILGIIIPEKRVLNILQSLNLNPVILGSKATPESDSGQARMTKVVECTIPTYRNDLKIEEDLIEEVARIYGYNNFLKTLPIGEIPTKQIPYFKDYRLDEKIKNILKASGFSEIYTYSLIGEKDLVENGFDPEKTLRIDNPISREFEYLRPTLSINLKKALKQNLSNFKQINLFEFGKIYHGENLDSREEEYGLAGISNAQNFLKIKGVIEKIHEDLGLPQKPIHGRFEASNEFTFFEIYIDKMMKKASLQKIFKPLPKYPPIIEDLAIVADEKIKTGELMDTIKDQSSLIVDVSLLDQFKDSRTFHIVYQDKNKNLTGEEVAKIREKILLNLKQKSSAEVK